MFTGIIESIGKVQNVEKMVKESRLVIEDELVTTDLSVGDSISVNGICLTATNLTDNTFSVDVMHETLDKTGLVGINQGDVLNLERAMPANGRFDGHIVSGHIDGVGEIISSEADGFAQWFEIHVPSNLLKYIIYKGSVTVDGVSLTVAKVDDKNQSFSISLIPHTLEQTTLKDRIVGDSVNIENDIVGKYIEKLFK